MNHVDIHRWIDAARGLLGESERAAAEAHAAACGSCRRTAAVMAGLASIARADAAHDPPQDVVDRALALFTPAARERGLKRVLASLVFDSRLTPVPAGMRSAQRGDQRLYHAGDYALDFQVTREQGSRHVRGASMVVVGQIASRARPASDMGGRPVLLVWGREVMARTLSNERGEFHLECEPRNRIRLQVWVGGDRKIEVPVSRITGVHKS